MDIRQLHYFIQVADCGNHSKASQKLFISQPALSKTIKNMEEEMGFTISILIKENSTLQMPARLSTTRPFTSLKSTML